MATVLLSLGSNLGDSVQIINDAIADIKGTSGIFNVCVSPFYLTKPVGYLDQNDFTNIAASINTTLPPLELLKLMQELEYKYKRVRLFKDGPRTLDIDLIAYDRLILNTQKLTLPHPRMHMRAFVLAPLNDIVPDFIVCGHEKSVNCLYNELPQDEINGVKRING
ncbi:MAG: 2-amino-4-hydroxy-6-hydroxymethyldihydropteridine diphosphokinase [Succinivibrio sp.]